jgi:uncharacterized protein YceK
MVRRTEHFRDRRRPLRWTERHATSAALVLLTCGALLVTAGCSSGGSGTAAGSSNASSVAGANMAGPAAEVVVSRAAIADVPHPWVLSTPESAVRSYLAWTSYAYRIATSEVASTTMGPDEDVRVDSYIQFNLEKSRVIDQSLTSISFGTSSVEGTHTLVPTKEKWTYSYVSIQSPGGKILGGPYSASYDATYTVVRSGKDWVVYSVAAKPLGTVK